MALPTCDVVCAMHDQAGLPVPGATFEITLNRFEVYEGFVVPAKVSAIAGADGTVTVALWPNQLGATESGYNVTMRAPNGKTQRVLATVPNVSTVNLHDVSTLPLYPGKPDAQVYIELAQSIVADAQDAAASSASSAAASSSSASASASSASASAASATAAAGSATDASASADSASGSAAASAGSAAAASGSAASASGFAWDAAGAAAASAASAGAAAASAIAASESASDVQNSLCGAVMYFARNTAPDGWLKANGAAVSRATYVDLFAAIGTTFGAGDGSTTFNLPDLRGEFVRSWDDGRGVDVDRAFGSAQADAIKAHNHTLQIDTDAQTPALTSGIGHLQGTSALGRDGSPESSADLTDAIASTGGAETRPRNVALLACIHI